MFNADMLRRVNPQPMSGAPNQIQGGLQPANPPAVGGSPPGSGGGAPVVQAAGMGMSPGWGGVSPQAHPQNPRMGINAGDLPMGPHQRSFDNPMRGPMGRVR